VDSVRDKYERAKAKREKEKAEAEQQQKQLSEKAGVLAQNRHRLDTVKSQIDRLGSDNGCVAKVRDVVKAIREHSVSTGDIEDLIADEKTPDAILAYLDQQLEIIEEGAPINISPEDLDAMTDKIVKRVRGDWNWKLSKRFVLF